MSETPEELRRAAEKVADACGDDFYWQAIFDAAVAALRAERLAERKRERERCAKIAESRELGPASGWTPEQAEWFETGSCDMSLAIAESIRRQQEHST